MTTFRDIQTKETHGIMQSILRMVEYLVDLEDKQTGIEYFETLMRYAFSTRSDLTKKDIHVVCAVGENNVWMITAYYPS